MIARLLTSISGYATLGEIVAACGIPLQISVGLR